MNPAADLPAHYAIFGELVTHDPLAAGSTEPVMALSRKS
jgi:hypothetical protein